MLSNTWFNLCVNAWWWLAQASPVQPANPVNPGNPAPAAPAPPAIPTVEGGPALNAAPLSLDHAAAYGIAHTLALMLYFTVCIALIICVMFQTTKNEGLSGVIGGAASSTLFKGKRSGEEMLTMWTTRLAVTFLVGSFLLWFAFGRGGH